MSGGTRKGAGDRKSFSTLKSAYSNMLRAKTAGKKRVLNTRKRQTRPGQRASPSTPF